MNNNSSIDYFPFNANFFDDDKIALVEGEFGTNGSYIAIRLLCKIYGGEGYFCQWGPDECTLFTRKIGLKISSALVDEIVRSLVRRGFFSKKIFDRTGILTSQGIQKRFVEAKRRYSKVIMRKDLLLVNVGSIGNIILVEEGEQVAVVTDAERPEPTVAAAPVIPQRASRQRTETDVELEILSIFFLEKNFVAPQKQYRKLMNFNLTGGRNWNAMTVDQKMAAADMWQQKTEDGKADDRRRFDATFLSAWKGLYRYVNGKALTDEQKRLFLDDRITAVKIAGDPYSSNARPFLGLTCDKFVSDFIKINRNETKPILSSLGEIRFKTI